jgi:hypothetical protein
MIHPKEREIERESEMRGRDRKYSMLFTRKRYIYLSYVICKLVFKLKLLFFLSPLNCIIKMQLAKYTTYKFSTLIESEKKIK